MTKYVAALVLVLALAGCATGRTTAPKLSAVAAAQRTPPPTQWVDTHGIEIAVPARWQLNRAQCGTPKANTVLWSTDGIATCLTGQPPRLSVVEFSGILNRSAGWYRRHTTRATIGGATAFRWNAGVVAGSRDVQFIFPLRRITVSVMSPHSALLRQMLASVQIVKVNADGCPTRPHPSYRTGSRPSSGQRFIPAGATGLIGCYYEAGWLDRSNRVGSSAAQRVAKVLNHASWGSSPAPRGSIASSECAPSWNSFSIAYFEYAHRQPVALTAHLDGCTHLGASNGTSGVRMSHAWVPTFWANVAYYGSVADVWGCGC